MFAALRIGRRRNPRVRLNSPRFATGYWKGTEIAAYNSALPEFTSTVAADGWINWTTKNFGRNANYVYPYFHVRGLDSGGVVQSQQNPNGQSPDNDSFNNTIQTIEIVRTTSSGTSVAYTLTRS